MHSPADLLRLRQTPMLDAARTDTFAMLMQGAVMTSSARGAWLSVEGQADDCVLILLEGTVELQSSWSDRGSTLALLRPPATIGLASTVLGTPALTSARVLTRSRLLRIPGCDLRAAMRLDVDLAVAVAEEVSGCFGGAVRSLKTYKLRGAVERLANYLLSQHRQQGAGPFFRLLCQKRVLASLLGMTPENLSRAFARLTACGVQVNGPIITLTHPEALVNFAKPSRAIDNHGASDRKLGQASRERLGAAQAEL